MPDLRPPARILRSQKTAALAALALACVTLTPPRAHATGGIEGTFEYAFDAPWRMEPIDPGNNEPEYGSIPIQLTIHDANLVFSDVEYPVSPSGQFSVAHEVVGLGNLCKVTVTEPVGQPVDYAFVDLAEVEASSGAWRWPQSADSPPQNRICRQWLGEACPELQDISATSEWHAVLWHAPISPTNPGSVLELTVEALVTRRPEVPCEKALADETLLISTTSGHLFAVPAGLTLRNHLRVYFGDRPLPRFSDEWLYGDLHYHSQGTDNEGESGYSYRGVVRAMGAMGIDFVMATEHASDSEQIVDTDIEIGIVGDIDLYGEVLRDMSALRFNTLNERIHGVDGVNDEAALEADGNLPQNVLTHGVVPQVYLGGEIDVIPENAPGEEDQDITYGNGLTFEIAELCGGWNKWLAMGFDCPVADLSETVEGGVLIKDIQGINSIRYGREHLVYLPAIDDATFPPPPPPPVPMCRKCGLGPNSDQCEDIPCSDCSNALCPPVPIPEPESYFVASNTGTYGGARRRLAFDHDGQEAMLPELEAKGYAFLAHPLNAGSGNEGPGAPPWTEHMLRQVWESPAILGLQLWNENSRRQSGVSSTLGDGDPAIEIGYERDEGLRAPKPTDRLRGGFLTESGLFELDPWHPVTRDWGTRTSVNKIHALNGGTVTWDRINHWGLDPVATAQLDWLEEGEPRRFLMAGGSDAHGDLNYRREGYLLGTDGISDTAIGSPRNLLHAGPGQPVPIDGLDPVDYPEVYGHAAVVQGLATGRFTVTDGPALRIVIDRNRNGAIDDDDIPMGGAAHLYGETELPLLVEWLSTEEFGAVARIDLFLGVQKDEVGRTYAPLRHGPRSPGTTKGLLTDSGYTAPDGLRHSLFDDQLYWHLTRAPGTSLRISGGQGSEVDQCRITAWECQEDGDSQFAGCETVTSQDSCDVCQDMENEGVLEKCEDLGFTLPAPDTPLPEDVFYGLEAMTLDLSAFEAEQARPGDRFFVRAFAKTHTKSTANGACDNLLGHCIERFAYTNPVWAVTVTSSEACPEDPQGLDRDGDGLPDGCDPCPTKVGEICISTPG